ncbi:hypothetical protein [Streptomyces sp. ISL-86]|uniref:hypothetical protein n=1 Tax=Streptomyces sp. ISL-86 TaxID=2819187 RepID=UPI001BE8937C|nr:hypothetical protein [Streptomyces sp. ISL-86]MBT2455842.1 hypothetical protein [Streptomyces sp. ISL-86]
MVVLVDDGDRVVQSGLRDEFRVRARICLGEPLHHRRPHGYGRLKHFLTLSSRSSAQRRPVAVETFKLICVSLTTPSSEPPEGSTSPLIGLLRRLGQKGHDHRRDRKSHFIHVLLPQLVAALYPRSRQAGAGMAHTAWLDSFRKAAI